MGKEIQKNNIIDYIKWRGDLKFNQDKLNKVDILMFSQLNLIDFDNVIPSIESDELISLKDASKKYFLNKKAKELDLGLIIPKSILLMFKKMKSSDRYKDILLGNYINDIDISIAEQISAMTFKINENIIVISFSGTDDTIIGWKEDLMMMYGVKLSSQIKACEYVTKIANKYPNSKLYITGHSKGGNLAIYSAINVSSEIQNRIVKVYSYDGPGQDEKEVDKILLNGMDSKIKTILPQASTVGRLFEHKEKIEVIYSYNVALYQHDAFSWAIDGKHFVKCEEIDQDSINTNNKIREVLSEMTDEERHALVDNLYELLTINGTKDLTTVYARRNLILQAYLKMPKEKRNAIFKPITKLLRDKSAQKTIFEAMKSFLMESKKVNKINNEIDEK